MTAAAPVTIPAVDRDRPPLLAARGLSVAFDGHLVLDGVDLDVRAGEIVAVLGENGAGKTTLVRCLAGEVRPGAGTVELIAGRAALGVVWQDLALCDHLDAVANVWLGREPAWLDEARLEAETRHLLDRLGIELPDLRRPVGTLSGGERQLVAVARAVVRRPAVCLLDEPTAALSVTETRTVEAIVAELRAAGAAVVLVTHAPESVTGLADRLVVLRRGQVVADVPAGELHPDDLLAVMAGADLETTARRQLSRLRETLDAAERSSRLAREFLSRLSHELRTPLTAIRGYATSLCATDVAFDEATTGRFLANIASESDRLGRLVSDLLDATALDSGALRLQCDWCDVAATVRAALAAVPGADTVIVAAPPSLPAVWADHDRLCQVVVNLVENALRHTPQGTAIQVRLSEGPRGGAVKETVELRVADDGPGVSATVVEELFLPWHRAAADRERGGTGPGSGGAGLGLSIARGIVAAHGGTVSLEPAPAGTTFLVRLPVEPAAGTRPAWEPVEGDADA